MQMNNEITEKTKSKTLTVCFVFENLKLPHKQVQARVNICKFPMAIQSAIF